MSVKEFHQQTVIGLLQTTVNRTYLDLIRRQLIDIESVVDWTNIRSLTNEINWLFRREIDSRLERQSLDNIRIEIQTRAPFIYQGIVNAREFETSLIDGIRAYSRYIKENNLVPPINFRGFY